MSGGRESGLLYVLAVTLGERCGEERGLFCVLSFIFLGFVFVLDFLFWFT